MNKLVFSSLVGFVLWACSEKPKDSFEDSMSQPTVESENSIYNKINLQFDSPIVLDSSDWVLYPLTHEKLEETEYGFKSSSYGRQYAYWNAAFFNTHTKETRLLSEDLKMLINSISTNNGAYTHSGQKERKSDSHIYYSITTKDYNQNGKLDVDDPKYLFISDISGQGFKQASPDNLDLIHWQTINESNKILIQTLKDSNKDKKFDGDDEIVSFIYDIGNQKIDQIFSDDFNLMTKKLFEKKWGK